MLLSPEARAETLKNLPDATLARLVHEWTFLARPDQLAPKGFWTIWLLLAGRGAGKTRSGSEWVREKIKSGAGRIALVAPTAADARDVMVEGDSGILATAFNSDVDHKGNTIGRPVYEPSKRRLTWGNGAVATLFSAEEPERLRGPQHHAAWTDEVAAWTEPDAAWDMLMFGLRLGNSPQVVVTTTPKPLPIIREMIRGSLLPNPKVVVTRAKTSDNQAHLAPVFLSAVVDKYKGTRLGRQELDGEVIDEVEGALWARPTIEKARMQVGEALPDFLRIGISIDPATTSGEASALTGITAGAVGADKKGYLLEDASGRYQPAQWAETAVALYDRWSADFIVAEGNQGGEMVRHTIHSVRPNIPVYIVHASKGKMARAEPVSALYDQEKIRHYGTFPELEDQMCTWEPLSGLPSPDRLDSLVWLFTRLMLGQQQIGKLVAHQVASGPLRAHG